MTRKLIMVALLWLMAFQSMATSAYYINRTDSPIRVSLITDTTAPVEEGNQYHLPEHNPQGVLVIQPYQKAKLATFNRYYGIENGATYNYYFHVSRQNEEGDWYEDSRMPLAQLKFEGHGAGTHLSYGYKDWNLKTDYDPYVVKLHDQNGNHTEYGMKAIYTSGFDDVEFVIAEHHVPMPEERSNAISVGTYNLWMIPAVSSDITERANLMEHSLSGYDVLALQEAFASDRDALFDSLSREYPYKTDVVGGDSMAMYDGGVVTLSRYPILETDAIIFNHCSGTDCHADKGIVYTKIDKNGQIYNIFNTHLASFSTPEAKRLRRLQLGLLRTFMLTKQIPSNEVVIFAGDFNIDKNSDFLEYLLMLATLEVDPPAYDGHREATFDPTINRYARANYSGGETVEYLDYVLVSSEHLRARKNINTVQLKQRVSYATWDDWHLSDHFAVNGEFEFDPIETE